MAITLNEVREMIKCHDQWLIEFQEYCNSEEIRDESESNGINTCGYGIQCDYCDLKFGEQQCARAMEAYYRERGIMIDFRNMAKEYFRKLLLGETE